MKRCLFLLHRIGPYHHARFQAVASTVDLHVLETRPCSEEYPWIFTADTSYVTYKLEDQPSPEIDPDTNSLDHQLSVLLDEIQPEVVVSTGWADRSYQRLLIQCHQRHLPLVIVSDSRKCGVVRYPVKEWIKRQLLRGYSSAFVAGSESLAYLLSLGFHAAAISHPCDVVDNKLFSALSSFRSTTSRTPHFLSVGRLDEMKNHRCLLDAYAAYQSQGGAWGLTLIGSGPLEMELRQAMTHLPDPSRAILKPFQQLSDLTISYSKATAFVLASKSDTWGLVVNEAMAAGIPCLVSNACGCAVDLIDHGRTGWTFDPSEPLSLSSLMLEVECQSPLDRVAMKQAARERLDDFSLQSFAIGFEQALKWAIEHPRWSRRATLWAHFLSSRR